MKFNLNEIVKVTLTEAGLRRLREHYAELRHDMRPPQPQDVAGRSVEFQLHELMRIFGPMLYVGSDDIPFEHFAIEIPNAQKRVGVYT